MKTVPLPKDVMPLGTKVVASQKSPGIAVLLSLFIPGAGSLYCERIGKGIGLMIGTVIGYYCLIIPGIILHIVSLVSAYNDAKETW